MVRLPIRLRSPLRPRHAALLPQNGHDPISGARNEMLRMRYALVMTYRARVSIYEADGDAFLTRRARRRRLPRAAAVVASSLPTSWAPASAARSVVLTRFKAPMEMISPLLIAPAIARSTRPAPFTLDRGRASTERRVRFAVFLG